MMKVSALSWPRSWAGTPAGREARLSAKTSAEAQLSYCQLPSARHSQLPCLSLRRHSNSLRSAGKLFPASTHLPWQEKGSSSGFSTAEKSQYYWAVRSGLEDCIGTVVLRRVGNRRTRETAVFNFQSWWPRSFQCRWTGWDWWSGDIYQTRPFWAWLWASDAPTATGRLSS